MKILLTILIDKMKKIIFLLFFFSISSYGSDHNCSIKDTIFFSYTLNHEKIVELCKYGDMYRFTFGVIGREETVLYRTKQNIYRLNQNGGVFRIINGLHSFTIVESKGKDNTSEMIIMERGNLLLRIKLDNLSNEYINKTFGWVI